MVDIGSQVADYIRDGCANIYCESCGIATPYSVLETSPYSEVMTITSSCRTCKGLTKSVVMVLNAPDDGVGVVEMVIAPAAVVVGAKTSRATAMILPNP